MGAANVIKTSSQTIRQWLVYCREVCFVAVDKLFEQEGQLGGDGITVENDETKHGRRKLHSGTSDKQLNNFHIFISYYYYIYLFLH